LKEISNLKTGVGGRIILKYALEKQNGFVDWINETYGRDQ
jgi:hypothetical protein